MTNRARSPAPPAYLGVVSELITTTDPIKLLEITKALMGRFNMVMTATPSILICAGSPAKREMRRVVKKGQ